MLSSCLLLNKLTKRGNIASLVKLRLSFGRYIERGAPVTPEGYIAQIIEKLPFTARSLIVEGEAQKIIIHSMVLVIILVNSLRVTENIIAHNVRHKRYRIWSASKPITAEKRSRIG